MPYSVRKSTQSSQFRNALFHWPSVLVYYAFSDTFTSSATGPPVQMLPL